jgi:sugar phosphate isomerase/epimerase
MRGMTSRRTFLRTVSTGVLASAAGPFAAPGSLWGQAGATALARPFKAGLALQLYSLRHRFQKGDVDGALRLTRSFGFSHVEGNAPKGMTSTAFAEQLKAHGLSAMGIGAGFEQLTTGIPTIVADAQALGAKYVMCAWIPHDKAFTPADAEKAVPIFNQAGKALKDAGLTFMYHIHGYEFQPGPDGTLFDTIAKRTDAGLVQFEMDVFWVVRGGGDPVKLFQQYPTRFRATHIKDMRTGTPVGDHTGSAPDDTNVPVGQGMIDWPAVFRAAEKAGVEWHIIEDESPAVETQIPQSLTYLAGLKI